MSFGFRNVTTGSISANGEAVTLAVRYHQTTRFALDVRGTFTGTLAVEVTLDGTNWTAIGFSAAATPTTLVTSLTAPGIWSGILPLPLSVRVKSTAWTSGTATIILVVQPE